MSATYDEDAGAERQESDDIVRAHDRLLILVRQIQDRELREKLQEQIIRAEDAYERKRRLIQMMRRCIRANIRNRR
jgi:hypothetical protein